MGMGRDKGPFLDFLAVKFSFSLILRNSEIFLLSNLGNVVVNWYIWPVLLLNRGFKRRETFREHNA